MACNFISNRFNDGTKDELEAETSEVAQSLKARYGRGLSILWSGPGMVLFLGISLAFGKAFMAMA